MSEAAQKESGAPELIAEGHTQRGDFSSVIELKNRDTPPREARLNLHQFNELIGWVEKNQCFSARNWADFDIKLTGWLYDRLANLRIILPRTKNAQWWLATGGVNRRKSGAALRPRGSDRKFSLQQKMEMAGRPRPDACECCGLRSSKVCWDHDHGSGKFRGWICNECNSVLGFVGDSTKRLQSLINYLEKSRSDT